MKKEINGKNYIIGESYKKPRVNYCYKYKDNNYYVYWGKWNNDSVNEGLYNKDGKIYLHKVVSKKKSSIDKDALLSDILNSSNQAKAKANIKNSVNILTEDEKKKIFAPAIRDTNDILVRLIKQWLYKLQLPEKELANRFDTIAQWNNFKRALIIRDSITVEGFGKWMDVLNLEWRIDIKEKNE